MRISLSVTVKGDMRLRELAKYLESDNFGVTNTDIKRAVVDAGNKTLGKTATGTQKNNGSISGAVLLQSINKRFKDNNSLTIDAVDGNRILTTIKNTPSIKESYINATKYLNINSTSSLGDYSYVSTLHSPTNQLFDVLDTERNFIVTNINKTTTNRFNSVLRNSTILTNAIEKNANNLLKGKKQKLTKKFSVSLAEPVAKIPISHKTQKERFLSGMQLTLLIRKHLYQNMRHSGEPYPPDLTYRTGETYVKSIDIFPNYRKQLIQYMYNPVLDSKHMYEYKVEKQTERSIRAILKQQYAREFILEKVS